MWIHLPWLWFCVLGTVFGSCARLEFTELMIIALNKYFESILLAMF